MAKSKKKPAHRPLKYGEETTMLHIRVPKTKKESIRKIVNTELKKFEK